MLDTTLDPKLAWALKHRERFPVDINRAPRETLLRVPGLGARGVERVLAGARAGGALRLADLERVSGSVRRMLPFVVARDWTPSGLLDGEHLRAQLAQKGAQLDLFDAGGASGLAA